MLRGLHCRCLPDRGALMSTGLSWRTAATGTSTTFRRLCMLRGLHCRCLPDRGALMSVDLNLNLSYALAVVLGMVLITVFRPVSHLARSDRTQYYRIQAITLIGAL